MAERLKNKKQFHLWLDEGDMKILDEIAGEIEEVEDQIITRTDLVRLAVKNFIKNYREE
jgi:hypothetical protein